MGYLSPLQCILAQVRCFSSSFSHLFGLFSIFPKLEFCELLYLLHKTLVYMTATVILPVLEFLSSMISLVLVILNSLTAIDGHDRHFLTSRCAL